MQQDRPDAAETASAAAVLTWLRAHPDFLATNPGLYDVLDPPLRIHGPAMADHMAAMVARSRSRAAEAERSGVQAASGRRDAEGFMRRVQGTVLALMRAPDPAWLATHELAGLLQVDAVRICTEQAAPPDGLAPVPRGTIAAMLGQRVALVRPAADVALVRPAADVAADLALLHGEAAALAAQEALIRVPLRTGTALLAIACRDATGLAGAGTDALAFLGQAVAAALERPHAAVPGDTET